ncbi:ferredoxin-dependent glutamate synthase, chloroplastic, partial [Tanacetum coccineum]
MRPGGEYHGNNPEMSKLLHKAVREKRESAYSIYQQHLANKPVNGLFPGKPMKQSPSAISMNRIGGKSNSKGGETSLSDVVDGYSPTLPHLKGLQNGDIATSVIKQSRSEYVAEMHKKDYRRKDSARNYVADNV